jgi:trehalose-6-phosphatase
LICWRERTGDDASVEIPGGVHCVAIGDDVTDEDMFKHLPPGGIGIHVGVQTSSAQYHLPGHQVVRALLRELVHAKT